MHHRIVIPANHAGNLHGCLESMNERTRERVIVVDNTELKCIQPADVVVIAEGYNSGVSRGWNLGIAYALNHDAEYVTICSSSMRFDRDGGDALCDVADFCVENTQWEYGFESLNGWHLNTVSRRLYEEIGPFDEDFYPAYMEDCDYVWRMRCAGILEQAGEPRYERKIPWVPGLKYECVQDAFSLEHTNIDVNWEQLRAYYDRKWGGQPGEEKYTTPFNL